MKKIISGIAIGAFALLNAFIISCKDDNEVLVWNEPPSSSDTLYQNPLFEPDLADPSIVRGSDGWFYGYGTENEWAPGIQRVVPIVRSKNLVKWEYVGDAFETKPDWKNEGGIWAPCVAFNSKEGRYIMFYSYSTWGDSNPGIGIATAALPYGPFTDEGKLFDSQSIGVANSIDPFFIEYGSGRYNKRYLFWGSFQGIYGIELSQDWRSTVGAKFKIAGNAFEACYIYPKDGKFYFFGSVGSCCEGADSQYRVTVACADDIKGPYKTQDGKEILNDGQEGTPFLKGDGRQKWVGPGHNAEIITDDLGHDYFLYHAIDVANPLLSGGATRRPLMMDEIEWVDGWPTIENGIPSKVQKRAPFFE